VTHRLETTNRDVRRIGREEPRGVVSVDGGEVR
jgi:hypothetical protein